MHGFDESQVLNHGRSMRQQFANPCAITTIIILFKFVNFKITKVITIIEIANTVRNPVFIPKIRNTEETTSPGLATDKFVKSIFSGDWKRGTLRTAFTKNKPNNRYIK